MNTMQTKKRKTKRGEHVGQVLSPDKECLVLCLSVHRVDVAESTIESAGEQSQESKKTSIRRNKNTEKLSILNGMIMILS